MAFPTVGTVAGIGQTSAVDPWAFSLSLGTFASGDLLIALFRAAAAVSVVAVDAGSGKAMTELFNSASDLSGDGNLVYYRWCDGTEAGQINVNWSATTKGALVAYRITGAENPATQPPEVQEQTGTGANPDPPNNTPTGGAKDYLWIAWCGADGEMADATAPTNYNNSFDARNSGTGGAAASNCRIAAGTRQLNASAENPGTFTLGAANSGWTALSVAVHPPGVTTPALFVPPFSYRDALVRR